MDQSENKMNLDSSVDNRNGQTITEKSLAESQKMLDALREDLRKTRQELQELQDRCQNLDSLKKEVAQSSAELTEANASLKMELQIRRQIEDELRKSAQVSSGILDNVPNPVIVHEADWTVSYANKALEEVTGFTVAEVLGAKPPFPWWQPDKYKEYTRILAGFTLKYPHNIQRYFRKKNGDPLWVELTTASIRNSEGQVISRISIWQNITERKRTEAQILKYQNELRSMASQLSLEEESERRNIATLIHAGVTQLLALSSMKLEVLINSITDPKTSGALSEIYKILQQAIDDTRALAFELSPPSLYDLGLESTLEELTTKFGEQQHIQTHFEDDGQPKPLDENTSILLLQAVRELFYNIVKHARAQHLGVSIRRVKNSIQITVIDDGVGFNPQHLKDNRKNPRKIGLFSIRERIRYVGGRLRIQSHPGQGSSITLITPLNRPLDNSIGSP
jgi:PAS domain S-box-containing protein